eukprot:m.49515 g.49515  ORF g.49515 m.49515 type:complete len:70 (+) comp10868_c0_seq1:1203-1412(+)
MYLFSPTTLESACKVALVNPLTAPLQTTPTTLPLKQQHPNAVVADNNDITQLTKTTNEQEMNKRKKATA